MVVMPLRQQIDRWIVILQKHCSGLAHHIDEPGRDDESRCVNRTCGSGVGQTANGADTAIANRHIRAIPGRARTINDATIANDQMVAWSCK